MAVADTAKLIASLELKDNISAGVSSVTGTIGKLETKFGSLGNALGHAKSQLSGLISGPLGLIGLGGGLYGVEQLISSSIQKTDTLGESIEKLTGVTGMSATEASSFVAVFSRFGLDSDKTATSMAFMEKAIGNLTKTTKTEATFSEEFGFSLRNTTVTVKDLGAAYDVLGNKKATAKQKTAAETVVQNYQNASIKDATTVFEDLADVWIDKTVPQSQKAALAAKLLGKGYVDLVPALNEGSQGIKAIEKTAQDLGLVMDDQNMNQLKEYHESMESMGMAVGALQLQIGLGLAPAMTTMAESLTDWAKNGGAKEVTKWMHDLAGFGKTIGEVFKDDVVPIFGAISDAWGKVPDDLKKLLIGGIVAQKASSWLFGDGGILGLLGSLGKAGVQSVGGALNPVDIQKVFVVNMGAGGMGGLGGDAAAAAGGEASMLSVAVRSIIPVAIAAASIYALKEVWDSTFGPSGGVSQQQGATDQQITDWSQNTPNSAGPGELAGELKLFRDSTDNLIKDQLVARAGNVQFDKAFVAGADKIAALNSTTPEAIQSIRDAIAAVQHMQDMHPTDDNTAALKQLSADLRTAQANQMSPQAAAQQAAAAAAAAAAGPAASHDTSGADAHATVAALQSVQSFFTQKPVVRVDGWADLLTHRDTSALDMHNAATSLDAAVNNWRNSPAPVTNVTVNVNTTVSAAQVRNSVQHLTVYTPGLAR